MIDLPNLASGGSAGCRPIDKLRVPPSSAPLAGARMMQQSGTCNQPPSYRYSPDRPQYLPPASDPSNHDPIELESAQVDSKTTLHSVEYASWTWLQVSEVLVSELSQADQ